jgi:hypothetical protein
MSLGDYVRLLRAQQGGHDHAAFAAAYGGAATKQLHLLEMRQRDISDDALLEKIAAFYHVPLAEVQWHRQRSRKALSQYLLDAELAARAITLRLRTDEVVTGELRWWDLAAIGLKQIDGSVLVVQRHAVVDWEGSETQPQPDQADDRHEADQ